MTKKNKITKENNNIKNEITKFNIFEKTKIKLTKIKLTQKQQLLCKIIDKNEIISVTGPAGTSKTFMALYYGLHYIINNKNNKNAKIFLTKPIIEAGEKLGFLPGEINEKINPYLQSYVDLLNDIIGKKLTEYFFKTNKIIFEPVAYMRGRNLINSFIILDEVQNFTDSQLMTLVTRKHVSSKIILLGDSLQNDRFIKNTKEINFIKYVLDPIKKNVTHFKFDLNDIMRDKLIIDVIKNYQKYINLH